MRNNSRSFSGGSFSMGFPPFTRAIKWLVIVNASIYLVGLLFAGALPTLMGYVNALFFLRPYFVVQRLWIWQLVTYSFFHGGLFHILFNMLTLWMFGATLEMEFGFNRFLELYFFGAIGGAFTTVAIAYLGLLPPLSFLGISPVTATLGASGAIYAVMVVFAMLHGDQEFIMFPLPISIRAKYLVGILIFISLAGTFQGFSTAGRGEAVAYIAHLGGALFGWLYVRVVPRRGLGFSFSERYFGMYNAYHRWKRRRAARKFEVYMRRQDRKEQIDDYTKLHDVDRDRGNGERRGPWIH